MWKQCYDTANKIVDSSNVIVVCKDVVRGETRSKSVLNGLRALPEDSFLVPKIKWEEYVIEPVLDELLISKVNKILSKTNA